MSFRSSATASAITLLKTPYSDGSDPRADERRYPGLAAVTSTADILDHSYFKPVTRNLKHRATAITNFLVTPI